MWDFIAHLLNSFWEISQTGKMLAERKAFKETNWKQFYSLVIPARAGYNGFCGATARIVTKEESIYLRIFARNEAGDYFLFISGPEKPYIKPLSRRMAKVALRKNTSNRTMVLSHVGFGPPKPLEVWQDSARSRRSQVDAHRFIQCLPKAVRCNEWLGVSAPFSICNLLRN